MSEDAVTLFRSVGDDESERPGQVVGARHHEVSWAHVEELDAFNRAILGRFEVVREWRG